MRNKIDNLHSEKYPPSVREFALKFEDNKWVFKLKKKYADELMRRRKD
jgi:hypothetical protein